jgi:hypothetical protein
MPIIRSEAKKVETMTTSSVTLSVQIACPAAEAYRFIADPSYGLDLGDRVLFYERGISPGAHCACVPNE